MWPRFVVGSMPPPPPIARPPGSPRTGRCRTSGSVASWPGWVGPTTRSAAYAAALERAPNDEGAMQGRADVLAALGRRAEAADTLDRLAANLERDGRLADACDVARRALELAESRGRRGQVESLVARLRTVAPGDAAASEALERALGVLESVPGVTASRDGHLS